MTATTITTRAKICPSNENYRKTDGNSIYDLLHYGTNIEFSDNFSLVELDCKLPRMSESKKFKIRFSSDRAYKRCKRLFSEGYYEKLPYQKENYNLF